VNGVTTGVSTPRMRSVAGEMLVSGMAAFVAAVVPAATRSHATPLRYIGKIARGSSVASVIFAGESDGLCAQFEMQS
jgi:hypothetical protein